MAFDNFFEEQNNNNPLVEMGNDWANSGPFQESSQFKLNICGDFSTQAYTGEVNYQRLLDFLRVDNKEYFDYRTYRSKQFSTPTGGEDGRRTSIPISVPFGYEADGQQRAGTFTSASLNERICTLDKTPAYEFLIESKNKVLQFKINCYYAGAQQHYGNPSATSIGGIKRLDLPVEYRAIQLITNRFDVFLNFTQELGIKNPSALKDLLRQEFLIAYQRVNKNNLEELDWLYQQLPNFVVNTLPIADLWQDLLLLLQYDQGNWFVDNNNLLKVVQGIMKQDKSKTYLYDKFEANPSLIKAIYDNLSGSEERKTTQQAIVTEAAGAFLPNSERFSSKKGIFAALMFAVTYWAYDQRNKAFTATVNFRIDATHRVNSNIIGSDASAEVFNLTQEVLVSTTTSSIMPISAIGAVPPSTFNDWVPETLEPFTLHPLELVYLTLPYKDGEQITMPFPAILVKHIAYQAEWKEVMDLVRVGFNILAIAGGVVAFASSSPAVILLAIADIGLAGVDLYVQAKEDVYLQDDAGKKFLDQWEEIYEKGGIAIALASAPQLVESVFGAGAKLLRGASKASKPTRNFLKQVLVSMVLEIQVANASSRTFRSVEIGAEALSHAGPRFRARAVARLEEQGVVFVRLVDDAGVETYSAVYKGEVLVPPGTAKELRDEVKEILTLEGSKLKKKIDELLVSHSMKNLDGLSLSIKSYDDWVKIIASAGGIVRDVKSDEYMINYFKKARIGGLFNPVDSPPTIWVIKEKVTDLEMFHESMHLRDFLERGKEKFLKGVNINGKTPLRDTLISDFMKEKYVFNRIEEEQAAWRAKFGKGRFSLNEMSASRKYLTKFARDCENHGIDYTKINVK